MFGFLNVYKPKGMTSFDVVAVLRKISHIRQIGHTGTLDPFAQGILPICIGKSTKLIEYLPHDKAYLATIQFGARTDTYDLDGKVIEKYDKIVEEAMIQISLKDFEGEIEQYPPIYSALKVNGKKLYEYAREGKEVEINPRRVNIYKIELREFDYENQKAVVYIECSKGTYIRSIANDLGQNLGCGGFLIDLIRTKSGDFSLETSIKLNDIKTLEDIENNLLEPYDCLNLSKYELNEKEKERVSHGIAIDGKGFISGEVVILAYGGKIFAIGVAEENKIRIKKVFEVS